MTLPAWTRPDVGALFVVSGPSGAGKSTLLAHVFDALPGLAFSVSATTRGARPGETDGVEYHFVSDEAFAELAARGELLEHAEVYGRRYGTPRAPVLAALARGDSVVLDIDTQGAGQVRRTHPECVTVFVLPPSVEAIAERLRGRGTDAPEVVERRIAEAHEQLSQCGAYDYLVLNDELTTAKAELLAIFVAALCRRERRGSWVGRVAPG
jgi:guanylate kinase